MSRRRGPRARLLTSFASSPLATSEYFAGPFGRAPPPLPGRPSRPRAPPSSPRASLAINAPSYLLTLHHLPTSHSAWTAARDLSSLSTREIETYVSSPAKKSGDLLTAYKIARDPTEWQRQRDEAQAEYDELQAAALYEQQQGEDQLESAEEGEESGAKKGKKRKSESGKGVVEDKKSKKAKLAQLAKSRVSLVSGGAGVWELVGGDGQTRIELTRRGVLFRLVRELPRRVVIRMRSPSAPSRSPSLSMVRWTPPPAFRSWRRAGELTPLYATLDNDDPGLKQVKDWRHKLQKVFIGKTPPSSQVGFLVRLGRSLGPFLHAGRRHAGCRRVSG